MICAKCGKELTKVLEHGSDASKTWLRKSNYDGAEWVEQYEQIKRFNFPYLPDPFWSEPSRRFNVPSMQFVKFSLCLKCTPKDFDFIGDKK
jgi:hypothetical protein